MTSTDIAFTHLSKHFGEVKAVHDLSFTVASGRVTGLLGPNGAGKTTSLRMLLGLVEPTTGSATIGGRRYVEHEQPARVVGAALEAASFHPGRSGRNHLRTYAPQIGVTDRRCDEVLELVGLGDAARRRVGGYSLGMRQRLGLATTLLGDPDVLVLDEPANGLDPHGIVWLRSLLRHLAGEGKTILVSSHMLSEVQQTVDDVVIIAEGRLVHTSTLGGLVAMAEREVHVVTPDHPLLEQIAARHGWELRRVPEGATAIPGVDAATLGAAAFAGGLELHQLTDRTVGLEDVFLRLTGQQPSPGTAP